MNHSPILVTGATGKTGQRIVQRLSEKGHVVHKGSRQADPSFDWADQSTWNAVVGGSPEHVILSNDGAVLYVNNVDDGTVSVIDVGDRKAVKTIPVGSTLHGIDLSDDGGTLFVVGFDLATGTYLSASLAPAPYHLAAVRGTGKFYVSSADEPKIWVVDQESLAVLGEIPIGGKGHQMVQGPGT